MGIIKETLKQMKSNSIKTFLTSFNILTNIEIDEFIQLSQVKHLNKSDFFIREGETCKNVAFILSGILRSFYTSDKEDEITYCITFPNNFMAAYSSFLTKQPTQENIQALTSTELIIISKEKIEMLALKYSNFVLLLKIIAEEQYIELEKRMFQLQGSNATKRYADLLKDHPKYIQTIPLKYLASYLSVSQRHLSRIRKEVSF